MIQTWYAHPKGLQRHIRSKSRTSARLTRWASISYRNRVARELLTRNAGARVPTQLWEIFPLMHLLITSTLAGSRPGALSAGYSIRKITDSERDEQHATSIAPAHSSGTGCVAKWRESGSFAKTVPAFKLPSASNVAWLLFKSEKDLEGRDQRFVEELKNDCPSIKDGAELGQEFIEMVRERKARTGKNGSIVQRPRRLPRKSATLPRA
jgi:hypothetical protein